MMGLIYKNVLLVYSLDFSKEREKKEETTGGGSRLKSIIKKELKFTAKDVKMVSGKDNNILILTKDQKVRLYTISAKKKLKFLRVLTQKFFFPNFKSQKKKSNFEIIDAQFAESLVEKKQKNRTFDHCKSTKSGKQTCSSLHNNVISFLLREPFNSKDKWMVDFPLSQLVSRRRVMNHKMHYPKNEFLDQILVFGNLRMEVIKDQQATSVWLANKSYLVSNNKPARLVYARKKFNFIFLCFAIDDRLKLFMFTFTKNLNIVDNVKKLRSKHVILISHFVQVKDALELKKG